MSRSLTLTAILLSMFLAAMEATVVATAMPSIVAELHGLSLYGWVGAIYMLASTLTMPLYGKVADLYGRKPVLLSALFVFLVGSVASGLARSMLALVVFRAVQGVGAGGIQPVALTIVGDLYRPEERAKVQGLFGAIWAFAGTSGPLLGGFLVHALSWRWVFFVNVPFALFSFGLLAVAFREDVARKKVRFDALGSLLLAAAVTSLLAGASHTRPAVTLPIGVLLLAAFVYVETRAADPVLPPSLFRRRVIVVSSLSSATIGALMGGTITYLPLYAQAVLGETPTRAGLLLAPLLVAWPVASTLAGRALPKHGYRPFVRGGLGLVMVACVGLFFALRARSGIVVCGACMGLLGAGSGLSSVATIIAVQESAEWNERGVATASNMFFRSVGGALTVGAMGAVVASAVAEHASPELLDVLLGPEHGKGLAPELLATLATDLFHGTVRAFVIVLVLGAVALVAGLLFPSVVPRAKRDGDTPPELDHGAG
jgi:EmrB/QacA subfamily drug resistance transporter